MPGGATLAFWGVRGSTPCAGPRYARYGGNTSCVSLEAEGHQPLVFDLGTGLREYGDAVTAHFSAELEANNVTSPYLATVLLTHLHWDHIIGLPFFTPAFRPDASIAIHGPEQRDGLGATFTGVMHPPYFPITPAEMGGQLSFVDTSADDFPVNGAKVRSRWVRHTDPTLGYRVELEGITVAYLSDHGPGCCPSDADDFVPEAVLELCDGADVVIHDSQHTVSEYQAKRHFGHCTVDYAVRVGREAGARSLVLFHHCPTHSDDDLDRILTQAQDLSARTGGPDVLAATEGLRLPVSPR
jgi:phosphoribosyl 1,2-cyclic phosphodiesterase